ncbi:MAG: hypothetical protein H6867_02440 [Rhodospirillales bacterium]|nr:hypothetical protein [Rhodospirillales bacterium]MCB9997048.1 hypothetical protein [Rhodospirillales bacterium]
MKTQTGERHMGLGFEKPSMVEETKETIVKPGDTGAVVTSKPTLGK